MVRTRSHLNNKNPKSIVDEIPSNEQVIRDNEIGLLVFSILSFAVSLPLPVVDHAYSPLGVHILFTGISLIPWWANPLLFAAWIFGFRREYMAQIPCSLGAFGLGLSACEMKEIPSFSFGYYAWMASLALPPIASILTPCLNVTRRCFRSSLD